MNKEPVMSVEYAKSLVAAVAGVLLTFQVWTPTADQMTAIFYLVAVLFPLVQAVLVRPRTTPIQPGRVRSGR